MPEGSEKDKIGGLEKLATSLQNTPPSKGRSFGEQVEQLRCESCGSGKLGYGELTEVLNLPKLLLLGALLLVGLIGRSIDNEFLEVMGFGIPIGNAAFGLFLKSNIRWIFTRWVLVPEPDWYAKKMEVFTRSFGHAFLHTNAGSLILIVLISIVAVVDATNGAPPSRAATAAQPAATVAVFRDDTNGYFSLVPPKGWMFERSDDARSKVTWRHPVDNDVLLRVIARAATEDNAQVLRDTKSTSTQYNQKGLKSVFAEQRLGNYQTAVVDQWPSPARSRLLLFVAGNVHFNIQYAAPSESLFRAHEAEAAAALESLSPLPSKASGGANAVHREELSWYKRYAFLLSKLGDPQASQALAAEGLAKHPSDPELKQLAGGAR